MGPRREPGFCCFAGVFKGGFGKSACRTWFFCGEFVVKSVVERGALMAVFWRRKTFRFLQLFFIFFHRDDEAALGLQLFWRANSGQVLLPSAEAIFSWA
jgi:hypothetical protein